MTHARLYWQNLKYSKYFAILVYFLTTYSVEGSQISCCLLCYVVFNTISSIYIAIAEKKLLLKSKKLAIL